MHAAVYKPAGVTTTAAEFNCSAATRTPGLEPKSAWSLQPSHSGERPGAPAQGSLTKSVSFLWRQTTRRGVSRGYPPGSNKTVLDRDLEAMTTPHLEGAAGRDRAHVTPDQACCRSANKATDPVDYPPTQARIHTCISRKKHPLPEGDF